MAYRDDIVALNADHLWLFDSNTTDQIGSADGVGISNLMIFTSVSIAEDATNCGETTTITSRAQMPSTTTINNSAQTRKAVSGWFMATAIQNPPKNIYGEGDQSQAFRFILGWGNNLMFEVDNGTNINQIFGDVPLAINRPYHLTMVFEGNGFGNIVRGYLDGVEQLNAQPTNRQPNVATLPARTVPEFGDPSGTVAVGGTSVVLLAPINGKWNHWATWDGADAILTDAEIRDILFEKGALADDVISSGSEAVIQSAIDTFSGTQRPDYPICIRIPANTGDTNFTVELNNITFDPLASVHIQYTGTAVLTVINTNGSNATIMSAPNGTIELKERTAISFITLDAVDLTPVVGARIYIEADAGGDIATGTELMNIPTNGSGIATIVFDYSNNQAITGSARKGTATPFYKSTPITGTIGLTGLSQTLLLVQDE